MSETTTVNVNQTLAGRSSVTEGPAFGIEAKRLEPEAETKTLANVSSRANGRVLASQVKKVLGSAFDVGKNTVRGSSVGLFGFFKNILKSSRDKPWLLGTFGTVTGIFSLRNIFSGLGKLAGTSKNTDTVPWVWNLLQGLFEGSASMAAFAPIFGNSDPALDGANRERSERNLVGLATLPILGSLCINLAKGTVPVLSHLPFGLGDALTQVFNTVLFKAGNLVSSKPELSEMRNQAGPDLSGLQNGLA